jgi:hypothetical protein
MNIRRLVRGTASPPLPKTPHPLLVIGDPRLDLFAAELPWRRRLPHPGAQPDGEVKEKLLLLLRRQGISGGFNLMALRVYEALLMEKYLRSLDRVDAELDLLAASGAFTSVAPYVEMLMGHGMPPTGKLLKRGIRPSLSIDVASSVSGDMFTQMRTALVAERILSMTATPDEKFAPTLTHKDVLEFATLQGARALGMAQTIGSLEVGKEADVVLLDTRKVNTQPVVDPEGTVVVYADTANSYDICDIYGKSCF